MHPWAADAATRTMGVVEFARRLGEIQAAASQLTNTNAWERAIIGSFDPVDVPPGIPAIGTPRASDHNDGEHS